MIGNVCWLLESLPLLSFFCICPSVSNAHKVQTYEGVYNIELTNSFAGDSIAEYLNEICYWTKPLMPT